MKTKIAMNRAIILIGYLFLLALSTVSGYAQKDTQPILVNSPDTRVSLMVNTGDNTLSYSIKWDGELMIDSSKLSLLGNSKYTLTDISTQSVDESWEPVWGQFKKIRNHYNEAIIYLDYEGVDVQLICRVYDSGVAFRFVTNANNIIRQANYRCDYNLPPNSKIYHPHSREREPIGPVTIEGASEKIRTPVVVITPSGKHLSLLESDLYNSPGFEVINFEVEEDRLYATNRVNTASGDIITPWRVILLEENIGDLVVNTVALNLATPNQLEDAGWIKPGLTLWDWRVHGYTAPDGFQYGINTESYLRFIDFATKHNIEYFLIDDAWYDDVNPGEIIPSDNLDLSAVSQYAKVKGVDLLLYYDRRKGNYGDDKLFAYYQSLGMKGIKYGFMKDDVPFTRNAIEKSAEHELLINFHDRPVPFTGISRTMPNAITKEYCHAQQDSRRAFTPETFIKMALINAIQGPLDMNNGNFDITGINAGDREKGPKVLHSYPTTVVAEVARTLIIFSGLVCIPDAPEAYEAKQDLFEFIREQPIGKWDESQVLHAELDKYITTARKQDETWFIGSVASQKGATLNIGLDFLKEGIEYKVTYYEDAKNTHCITNPEAYLIRHGTVQKGDIVKAVLAPGGGHCMWIRN